MSWNIFKRVALLEQQVKDLTDFNSDHSRWIARLEEKAQKLENANQVLVNSNQALIRKQENLAERVKDIAHEIYTQSRQPSPYAAAPVRIEGAPVFTKEEVSAEEMAAREKKLQYHREWYKQNKIKKAAREKKNAYARAYYARKKGQTNA